MYGEAEFWFSSIKVVAIVAFIVLGAVAIIGLCRCLVLFLQVLPVRGRG